MRLLLVVLATFPIAADGSAFTRTPEQFDAGAPPYGLSADCTLEAGNFCAGWIWVFNDVEGAVWGHVFDPLDCDAPCSPYERWVTELSLYSRCSTVPGRFGGVEIWTVDRTGCLIDQLWVSGPLTVTHCVSGDRWTVIPVGGWGVHAPWPFAVTIEWGPQVAGSNNPQFATDNGLANLYCARGYLGQFPGCSGTTATCPGWTPPPQNTFIYVTDFNGDTVLEDLCALYGGPYPLSFPYYAGYGYLPNNLMMALGMECGLSSAVEQTSWGRVKAIYE